MSRTALLVSKYSTPLYPVCRAGPRKLEVVSRNPRGERCPLPGPRMRRSSFREMTPN